MTSLDHIPDDRWDTSVSFIFIFGIRHTCTYCGNPADGLDHVMPWTVITSVQRKGRAGEHPGVRTYCCRQCNSILGSLVFPTMWLRIMHVNQRLRVLLAAHMAYKIWTREETLPMGPNLRRQCEVKTLLRRVAGARIGWPYDPALLEMLFKVRAEMSDDTNPHHRIFLARFFAASVASAEGDP